MSKIRVSDLGAGEGLSNSQNMSKISASDLGAGELLYQIVQICQR